MSVTVPADTDSWAEAVASGFYGERTDPLPDEVYGPDFTEDDLPASLTDVDPVSQSAATTGPWQLTCTGQFPIKDKNKWRVVILAADGTQWESLDLTVQSLTTLVAHYLAAPTNPEAQGAGNVVLRFGDQEKGRVVFTWDP